MRTGHAGLVPVLAHLLHPIAVHSRRRPRRGPANAAGFATGQRCLRSTALPPETRPSRRPGDAAQAGRAVVDEVIGRDARRNSRQNQHKDNETNRFTRHEEETMTGDREGTQQPLGFRLPTVVGRTTSGHGSSIVLPTRRHAIALFASDLADRRSWPDQSCQHGWSAHLGCAHIPGADMVRPGRDVGHHHTVPRVLRPARCPG